MTSYVELYKNTTDLITTYIKPGNASYAGDNSGFVKAHLTNSGAALNLRTSKEERGDGPNDTDNSFTLPNLNTIIDANTRIQLKGINYSASSPDHFWQFNECAFIVNTFGVNVLNNTGYTINPVISKFRVVKNQPNVAMSSYMTNGGPDIKSSLNGNDELFPTTSWSLNNGNSNFSIQTLPISSFNANDPSAYKGRVHVKGSPAVTTNWSCGVYKTVNNPKWKKNIGDYFILSFYARSKNTIANQLIANQLKVFINDG